MKLNNESEGRRNTQSALGRSLHLSALALVALTSACTSYDTRRDSDVSAPPVIEQSIEKENNNNDATTKFRYDEIVPKSELLSIYGLKSHEHFVSARWSQISHWPNDDLVETLPALIQSCSALKKYAAWETICKNIPESSNLAVKDFYEDLFVPFKIINDDGSEVGLITGYYEPLLKGSRTRSERYPYPIYSAPDDLVSVDTDQHPSLKDYRGIARESAGQYVPYYTRKEIEEGLVNLSGKELFWVEDKVELFFLQIQGSGRIELEDGETVRVGFAKSNGHPYRSIGRILVERGDLPLSEASMQGIKNWGENNPTRLNELLRQNPSYVFFRILPENIGGPIGSLGVPLTPERSIAVDNRYVPAGFPVFIETTQPNSDQLLARLMYAQDRGGAIKGAIRADYFWGFGDEAGRLAGSMKQRVAMWALIPKSLVKGKSYVPLVSD